MRNLLIPQLLVDSYHDVNYQMLEKNNIKLLICDVDNTLVTHDVKLPTPTNIEFIKELKKHQIIVVLVTNNIENRIKEYAVACQCDYYSFSLKPTKKVFYRIMSNYQLETTRIAILGDQIFTDILGGNRMGIFTILTKPLETKDIFYTKPFRWLEKWVMKKYEKEMEEKRHEKV